MKIQKGFVCHIKDDYMNLAVKNGLSDKLMSNKEGNQFRPTYYCQQESETGIIWGIPMSSRLDKFKSLIAKDIEKYGRCAKIVIGEYSGKESAFLVQNMFPMTEKYIDHLHTVNGNPVPVESKLQAKIDMTFREAQRLHKKGAGVIFTNIDGLKKLMLDEINAGKISKRID